MTSAIPASALPQPQGIAAGVYAPDAHPLVEELRHAVLDGLGHQLDRMFARAGDELLAMSETAENEALRHAHFDTMRLLAFEQAQITRGFHHEILRSLGSAAPATVQTSNDLHLALLPEQELDENILLARMASLAKSRAKEVINALEKRLETIERELLLPAAFRALTPRRICDAYSVCLNKLDLSYGVRRILLRLFERTVFTEIGALYQELHAVLDRHALRVDPPPARSTARAEALARVQRIVAYELGNLINGRRLHPGARRFLCCAMAPLMSMRLLRDGVHSKLWHDALTRVAHLLRTLEPRRYEPEHRLMRNEQLEALAADLRDIGFLDEQVTALLANLHEAYAALDAAAASLPRGVTRTPAH